MIYITTAFHYNEPELFREEKKQILALLSTTTHEGDFFSPCFLSPMIGINKKTTIGAWLMMMMENSSEVIVIGEERTNLLNGEIELAQKLGIPVTFLS